MSKQELQDKLNRHLDYLIQDSSNVALLLDVCDLYQQLGEFTLAQAYLDRAKAINYQACLSHQGLLHLAQGYVQLASDCLREALSYDNTPENRYHLGLCHYIAHEFEAAWNVLAPLIDQDPSPDALLLMARVLHRQGSIEKAIGLTEDLLDTYPSEAEPLGLLALLYFDLNEEELASQTAQRVLELNPDNYDAKLVNILMRIMSQDTRVEEIEALMESNPLDSRLWFALGNAYMTQGDLGAAEYTLKKGLALYPEFYDCYIALAWCQLIMDELDEAEETYQNATNLEHTIAEAWGGLALVYALRQDYWKAELYIEKANDLNPNCFLTEMAESIYYSHENPKKAKQHLTSALKNTNLPIGKKLAFVIEDLSESELLH